MPAGNNPIIIVAAPNGLFIYVLNHDDSTVQEFAVGSDGTLTSKNTYPITGTFPTSASIDPTGKFLYVTYTYQTGYSATTPAPAESPSSRSTPTTPLARRPTRTSAITLSASPPTASTTSCTSSTRKLRRTRRSSGSRADPTTGALTPVPGTTIGPAVPGGPTVATGFPAGVTPSAIADDPRGHFVYVTDRAANQLIGYVVQGSGVLVPMVNAPFTHWPLPGRASPSIHAASTSTRPTTTPIR